MTDAASTGTLVLVALSGGGGALLGAILGQAVQLRRDKKQYEREDARHERERQHSVEDERRKRREDRYVSLLTQLTELDRALEVIILLVPQIAENRGLAERRQALDGFGDVECSVANICATACRSSWSEVEARHHDVSEAAFTAYAVASAAVRERGLRVTDWPLPIAGVHVKVLTDCDFKEYTVMEDPGVRHVDREAYVEHITHSIGELRDHIAELDRCLREELRLT